MEKIKFLLSTDTKQTILVGGYLVTIRMTWLPVRGVMLFGAAFMNAEESIVDGVVITPFTPLLTASARRRSSVLTGNFFCLPEDNDALDEDIQVTFDTLKDGRFSIYYVDAEDVAGTA